jgi:hypothetical protein
MARAAAHGPRAAARRRSRGAKPCHTIAHSRAPRIGRNVPVPVRRTLWIRSARLASRSPARISRLAPSWSHRAIGGQIATRPWAQIRSNGRGARPTLRPSARTRSATSTARVGSGGSNIAHHPEMPRSEEGLRRGGHTRPVGSTAWGHAGFVAPTNTPGEIPRTRTSVHMPPSRRRRCNPARLRATLAASSLPALRRRAELRSLPA